MFFSASTHFRGFWVGVRFRRECAALRRDRLIFFIDFYVGLVHWLSMKALILSPLFLVGGYGTLWVYRTYGDKGIIYMCIAILIPLFIHRLIAGEWLGESDDLD